MNCVNKCDFGTKCFAKVEHFVLRLIHHHNRYNAYCLADDVMEPYRPYVDELVFSLVKLYGANLELTKEIKSRLLVIPTLDVRINGKRSPLMVAVAQTTASLYKCFCGEIRRISYPER